MVYKIVETVAEMEQIIALQRLNLYHHLSEETQQQEGFVTAAYSVAFLQRMNSFAPSVIAVDKEKVIGYCLAMAKDMVAEVPILEELHEMLQILSYHEKPLSDMSYLVMGQVCIDKAYRGKGIFDRMYQFYKEIHAPNFNLVVTDVNLRNTRSLKAHAKVGFLPLKSYTDSDGQNWQIIAWGIKH